MKILFLIVYIVCLIPAFCFSQHSEPLAAQQRLVVTNPDSAVSISRHISFLRDPSGSLSLEDVMQADGLFESSTSPTINFNQTKDAIWLKVEVENNHPHMYFEVGNSTIFKINYFYPTADGTYAAHETGFLYDFGTRLLNSEFFLFPINQNEGPVTYFFRMESHSFFHVPIKVGSSKILLSEHRGRLIFYAVIVGILCSLFLYNFFIFVTTRRLAYLYYIGYVLTVMLTYLADRGVLHQYLFTHAPMLQKYFFSAIGISSQAFLLLFISDFLETSVYAPKLHKAGRVIFAIILGFLGLSFAGFYSTSMVAVQLIFLVVFIMIFLFSYQVSKAGKYKGVLHLLGVAAFFLGGLVYLSMINGFVPNTFFTVNAYGLAACAEGILFSFALAKWINEVEEQKNAELVRYNNYMVLSEASLQSSVKKLRDAETQLKGINDRLSESQEAMRAIAEDQLEQSEALLKAEKELQRALQEEKERKKLLLDTQSQLVNNEKMASLGQLTAGIAHEINNPINFIYNGIDTLKLTYSELKPIVNKVKEFGNGHDENLLIDEIVHLRNEYQIEELKSDMHELVSDIKLGAVRTMEIVKGLRVFSRLDEEEQKPANINENIEATLVLLRNKTKNKIEIRKDFETSNQEILCYPGQLNQVFMNIIGNAIQAIPEDRSDGKITITTELNEHMAIIRIKDNGVGMPESVRKRIFEPFFTTKPVGVGTGLGLSISYGIIEKHKGQMFVTSEEGKGTEFVIHIPRT